MATYELREKRAIKKSIYTYLETQLNASFSGISLVDNFKDAYATSKPVVCVQVKSTSHVGKEVGTTELWDSHLLIINIFAERSPGQAADLADFIIAQLKVGCPYYGYSKTSTTATWTATQDGRVNVREWIRDEAIDLGGEVSEMDQYRHIIACTIRKT